MKYKKLLISDSGILFFFFFLATETLKKTKHKPDLFLTFSVKDHFKDENKNLTLKK